MAGTGGANGPSLEQAVVDAPEFGRLFLAAHSSIVAVVDVSFRGNHLMRVRAPPTLRPSLAGISARIEIYYIQVKQVDIDELFAKAIVGHGVMLSQRLKREHPDCRSSSSFGGVAISDINFDAESPKARLQEIVHSTTFGGCNTQWCP